MKYAYVSLLLGALLVVALCYIYVCKKRKGALRTSALVLLASCAFCLASYLPALYAHHKIYALVWYSLVGISEIALVVIFAIYTMVGTDLLRNVKSIRIIFTITAIVDAILLLSNIFTNSMYSIKYTYDEYNIGFYSIGESTMLGLYHFIFCTVMLSFSMILLLYRIYTIPKLYRFRYWILVILVLVILWLNILYVKSVTMFNYSAVFCGYFNIFFVVLTFNYTPNLLIEYMYESICDNSSDMILVFDRNKKYSYSNHIDTRVFKEGNNADYFNSLFVKYYDKYDLMNSVYKSWLEEVEDEDGKIFLTIFFRRIEEHGKNMGSVIRIHDSSDEVVEINNTKYLATHDELSNLYSRDHFFQVVSDFLKRYADEPYYMVCTDIRNFKMINEIYGEARGDEILVGISEFLHRLLNGREFAGRMTADRFAICMPKARFDEELFLQEIRRVGLKSVKGTYRTHMFVGVYEITDVTMPVSIMCDRANLAIKSVKKNQEGCVVYYDESLREQVLKEQYLISEFPKALENGEFDIYLQPQTTISGNVFGAEALVRWMHPEKGLIPPVDFIELFEQSGYITKLDLFVWDRACQILKKWKEQGYSHFYLSVNISPMDFYNVDIYETMVGLVKKYGIDVKSLRLEITETAFMTSLNAHMPLIERLQDYGFIVEMDDFGSGYSSLNTLKDISVDTLKIDMGFLSKTENEVRGEEILGMVVSLSKNFDMEVVAEGVKTKEQVDFLTALECDLFQGYFFAKPMPISEFEANYMKY